MSVAATFVLVNGDELLGLGVGQRIEKNAVNECEECDVGTDTESNDEDGDHSEARCMNESAGDVAEVAAQGVDPGAGPGGASLVAEQSGVTELAQGRCASRIGRHAGGNVLVDLALEV